MSNQTTLRLCLLLATSFTFSAGCSQAGEPADSDPAEEEDVADAQQASSMIDLVMQPTVQIEANGVLYTAQQGGTVSLPCGASSFRVHYSYAYMGNLAAPSHQHTSQFYGPQVYMQLVPSLPAGVGTFGTFGHSLSNVPANTYYTLTVKVDDPSIVGELHEDNNNFSMSIRRSCIMIPI